MTELKQKAFVFSMPSAFPMVKQLVFILRALREKPLCLRG